MKSNVKVERLSHPERQGDWHDKSLKWAVLGPDSEVQKFSTQKEANSYAKIRRQTKDFATAQLAFLIG